MPHMHNLSGDLNARLFCSQADWGVLRKAMVPEEARNVLFYASARTTCAVAHGETH